MNDKPFGIACTRCRKCGYTWGHPPGPTQTGNNPGCPKCGELYCDWINYEQWKNDFGKTEEGKKLGYGTKEEWLARNP